MIICGTVGERAAEGTEALSTASVSDRGEMLPPMTPGSRHQRDKSRLMALFFRSPENSPRDAGDAQK